jgi:outer membrane protein OmpA-like peptidoglycan-associated protein
MRIFLLVVTVAALIGCTTTDPYSGEQKTSNTAKGAGIGALTGAVAGVLAKDSREGAIAGAVGGAAVGGGIGYYMDRQEAKLREQLQGTGVQVKREGKNIRLIMPGNITFATGRAEVKSDFYSVLDSVSQVLKEFDETRITVSGHTDSTGSAELNQTLSEQRAGSVKSYLQSRGIPSDRITAYGYGYRFPIASNDTPEGRQANRRVELELDPIEQ